MSNSSFTPPPSIGQWRVLVPEGAVVQGSPAHYVSPLLHDKSIQGSFQSVRGEEYVSPPQDDEQSWWYRNSGLSWSPPRAPSTGAEHTAKDPSRITNSSALHTMARSGFFRGCAGVNIHGGNFYDVNGNLVVHSRRGSDNEMPSMSSRSPGYRADRTGPPSPQSPQFSPSQNPVTGGTSNAEKTHIDGVSNDNSQNYYQSGAPPDNRRQPHGPKWISGPDQGTIPSTKGPHRRGQSKGPVQVPFQARNTGGNYDPQAAYSSSHNDYMNTGMANLSLNGPRIPAHLSPTSSSSSDPQIDLDQMGSWNPSTSDPGPFTSGPHGRGQSFKAPVQAPFQVGNTGGNYDPQAAYSSSHDGRVNTGMANLSLDGPRSPTHLSPPTSSSSDSQIGFGQMDSSNPSASNLSHPGPNRMDEEPSSDTTDEQMPTAAQSTASRRPATISELAERANIQWDKSNGFKYHLKLAEKFRREGKEYARSGDMENAFVELAKAATLVLERLPEHPDYNAKLNKNQRHNLGLNGQEILDNLAELKPGIVDRYEKWCQAHPDGVDEDTTPNVRTQQLADDNAARARAQREAQIRDEEAARNARREQKRREEQEGIARRQLP